MTKRFGDVVALDDLDVHVRDEEFLVLVGPSGCGKSTALRIIAGLETPTEGDVYIGDRVVNDLPPKDRDISMVFQSYALYPHKSVYENIAFPLRLRQITKEYIDDRVRGVADLLGIEELLERRPKELSGGQRQRVALGRAIIREPKVFLMDEPLSNLDAKLRVRMRAELKRLHRRLKVTSIYVTHDQVEAMTMGQRIAILRRGVLNQLGTPDTVFREPRNVFVAGFIGSPPMNFHDATIVEADGRTALDFADFQLSLSPDVADLLGDYRGKTVVFGIRPTSIFDLALAPGMGTDYAISVTVDVVEPMGSEIVVHLTTGDKEFIAVFPPESKAVAGGTMQVAFDPQRIHIFDDSTEDAIV